VPQLNELYKDHGHSHDPPHSLSSKPPSITPPIRTTISGDGTSAQKIPIRSHNRSPSDSSLYGHPAATRASLVQTAHEIALARSPSPSRRGRDHLNSRRSLDVDGPHGGQSATVAATSEQSDDTTAFPAVMFNEDTPLLHDGHSHSRDSSVNYSQSRGHSHAGSMNMRALVLHVLGDALGNVGVIATGLVIWLTSWSFKYYFDPIISLVITVIIFSSALPLGKSLCILYVIHILNPRLLSPQRFVYSPARRSVYNLARTSQNIHTRCRGRAFPPRVTHLATL
jgi:zinc transporter 1